MDDDGDDQQQINKYKKSGDVILFFLYIQFHFEKYFNFIKGSTL